MPKILLLILFTWSLVCHSQPNSPGKMVQIASTSKDDNQKIQDIYNYIASIAESDPLSSLKESQELLVYSQQNNDRICEGLALCFIGYMYRGLGNTVKSLEYNLRAVDIGHETGNDILLAVAEEMTATNYKDLGEYPRALKLEYHAEKICEKLDFHALLQSIYSNISHVYILMNMPDSALIYAQKDYELSIRKKYYHYFSYTLINLGDIHNKLGKPELALTYYGMAIDEGFRTGSPKMQNWAYTAKARFFLESGNVDSVANYARKAISSVEHTPFMNYSITPAKLLLNIYENRNIDSTGNLNAVMTVTNRMTPFLGVTALAGYYHHETKTLFLRDSVLLQASVPAANISYEKYILTMSEDGKRLEGHSDYHSGVYMEVSESIISLWRKKQ